MKRVVITDFVTEPAIERKVLGEDVEIICLNETEEDNYSSAIETADALLVWHGNLTETTYRRLKSCKVIVRYGTGYDTVDIHAARRFGIDVCNTPDYGVEEVADTTCAFLLSGIRKTLTYERIAMSIENGWQTHGDQHITRTNKHRLGIIGAGRIGTAVATRMKAFGIEVNIFDPFVDSGYEKAIGTGRFDTLDELLRHSTAICIHTPLSDQTIGMIDTNFIEKLNPGAIFVNSARGALVEKLDVLMQGLRNGQLSFVGLDVLPDEPPHPGEELIEVWKDKSHPLSHQILINPHSAFYSHTAWYEMREKAAMNLSGVLAGKAAKNLLN